MPFTFQKRKVVGHAIKDFEFHFIINFLLVWMKNYITRQLIILCTDKLAGAERINVNSNLLTTDLSRCTILLATCISFQTQITTAVTVQTTDRKAEH